MSRRSVPDIPKSALRDYEGSEQQAAVWRRLKPELRVHAPRSPRSALVWAWAPALALAGVLFGSGVLVGARFVRPQALPVVQAEPQSQAAPATAPASTKNTVEAEPPTPAKALHPRARRTTGGVSSPSEPFSYAPSEGAAYSAASPAPVAEWKRAVESGDFVAARRAVERQGGFDVAIAHASPSELMTLVDIARAAGERGQASNALRQVIAHPDAPEAPLAAWTLGNLLEQSGDAPGAAQAFALYRRLSPAGDFAEDAAARQIDVALAGGNVELTAQLVEDYARDFPHARRLGEFRRAQRALADRDAGAKPEAEHDDPEDESDEPRPAPSAPTETR